MYQKNKTSPRSPNGVYLFTGEDEFRKELSLERLKKRLLGERKDPFNYELYYGNKDCAEEIIRSLETLPLTAERKLVVLKEPELLPEKDQTKLTHYLKDYQKSKTVFVILTQALPAADDHFSKALSEYARVVNFARLKPGEIISWIIKEFKERNKIINSSTAKLLSESAQEDLGQIFSLIEQLSIFTGDREKITADDLSCFCRELPESSAFELLDCINDRDAPRSLRILKSLLRSDNNPSQIIGLLGWHTARLINIKRMLKIKISKDEMASCLNVSSFILNRLVSQAENFTLKQLKDHLNLLLDTELMLKKSNIDGELLLEMLLVSI